MMLPTHVMIDETVTRVVAESPAGSFCLLENHIDFVSSLVPGIFSYTNENEEEIFVAVDEGTLVKKENNVFVSTRRAVISEDLEELNKTVEKEFRVLDEKEKKARVAVNKIEAGFIRRFLEIQQNE
jgi:F-type H+-transporting ATPase subunit epsilon